MFQFVDVLTWHDIWIRSASENQYSMKRRILSLALMISLIACSGDKITIQNASDFETYLQEEMEESRMPALAVLIFGEDQILFEEYYGKAHVEHDIDLTRDHTFLLASVSKIVTASALLHLYDKGHFALEDPINDYLTSFQVKNPNHPSEISFEMLLTHTSSIADGDALNEQYYYGEDSPIELQFFIGNYFKSSGIYYSSDGNFHNFLPGSRHEYSNTGNTLMAVLVEDISKSPFDEYCVQNIFTPLNMSNSFWHLENIPVQIAQPHVFEGGSYQAIEHYTFTDYPNGGLRSTARDMMILLRAFIQDGSANGYTLLKPSTVSAMISPRIPGIDRTVGLHMFLLDEGHNIWGHDGGEEGTSTIVGYSPDTNVGVVILTNQSDVDLDEILVEAYKVGVTLSEE